MRASTGYPPKGWLQAILMLKPCRQFYLERKVCYMPHSMLCDPEMVGVDQIWCYMLYNPEMVGVGQIWCFMLYSMLYDTTLKR
ncbi:hypothetical protein RRG08_057787 [Elysia crispata]|uniref:Uncharacterized protein n=1 Tax=Elysia crispata TaxID=231223 RepID=A0AAE0Z5K5_9GAST|nr:hypothetical protein RRG08_057787 [Elysia crispata]